MGRLPWRRPDIFNFRQWPTKRKIGFAIKTSAALVSVSTVAYYWPELRFVEATISRSFRTATTLASCTLDYKRHYPFEDTQEKKDEELSVDELVERRHKRSSVHQRAANRLLTLFKKNGGIYIKLGQHMSALEHILPLEYSTTMSVLQNQAPVSSIADVSAVIREDLDGKEIDDIFESFDEVPIGAASLAQVHKAKLKSSGQEVAVKVQHHRLQAFVDMDMLTVSAAVKVVKYVFPQFEFGWLADEMKTNLPKELDFMSEAHNSERLCKNLERTWPVNCPIHIPRIHWNLTSKRVLVMEYCDGAKITDVEWMNKNRLNPRTISSVLTKLYAQMIFLHGFVHCDPHPGNIFVQKDIESGLGFRIILLDHGLYRELPDSFRLTYARLWRALIDGRESEIRKYADQLGGGDAYKLFSTVLTHRSWDTMVYSKDWDKLRQPIDVARFREKASDYLPLVAQLLSRLPRPLLLLLKTNDLLRAVDRALQADDPRIPSPTFLIMGQYCIEAINEERWSKARGNIFKEAVAIVANLKLKSFFLVKQFLFELYVGFTKLTLLFTSSE